MNYKKLFSAAALATLLSLSNTAFSEEPIGYEEDETSYYVRGQWNGELFNIISGKELKFNGGSGDTFTTLKGHDKAGTGSVTDYKPSYKTPYTAGSVAVGYKMEDIRVELEGLYSILGVDATGYGLADSAKAFGTANPVKNTGADAAHSNYNGTNEGIRNIAGIINVLYDIDLGAEEVPVIPYVGVGAGVSHVTHLNQTFLKPAYQAKTGLSYAVTPEIRLHAGYRYFGCYGDDFKGVPLSKASAYPADPSTKNYTIKSSTFGVHGLEAGVTFHF